MSGPSKSKHIFIITLIILLLFVNFTYAFGRKLDTEKVNYLIPKIEEKIKQYPKFLCGLYVKASWLKKEINVNGDYPISAASLIKLPIAVVLLTEIENGRKSFNDYITFEEKHFAWGSGTIKYKKKGTQIKIKDAFELMLSISDNVAFNLIVDYLGGIGACNRRLAELGLHDTILIEYIKDFSGRNKVSSHDMVKSLELVFEENKVNLTNQNYFRNILFKCSNRAFIKRVIDSKYKFAHKTGTIGVALGDAGVIYLPWNKKIYISIIIKRPFDDEMARKLLHEVTRLTIEALT